jgi:hypothetical protein
VPTGAVTSVNGATGDVTVTAASLGLGAVNNTSDADKPVSTSTAEAISNAQTAATTAATAAATSAVEATLGAQISSLAGSNLLD